MPKSEESPSQLTLPGVRDRRQRHRLSEAQRQKIAHVGLLGEVQGLAGGSLDLVRIYREVVLGGQTRTIQLLGRKCSARIIETLLGFEVQAEYRRIQCPDLVTARYVKLFAELGCRTVKLPYDPTVTAALVPSLEAFAANLRGAVEERFPADRPTQLYALRKIFAHIRARLRAC